LGEGKRELKGVKRGKNSKLIRAICQLGIRETCAELEENQKVDVNGPRRPGMGRQDGAGKGLEREKGASGGEEGWLQGGN